MIRPRASRPRTTPESAASRTAGYDRLILSSYDGWATATGRLAEREAAWARQAQREAEVEVEAIKRAVEG